LIGPNRARAHLINWTKMNQAKRLNTKNTAVPEKPTRAQYAIAVLVIALMVLTFVLYT
jgi:hypothetical protein